MSSFRNLITEHRLGTLSTGVILSVFCASGMLIGNVIPHERRVTTIHNDIHRRIVKRVVIVRRMPVAVPVPETLADMRRACGGDPVRVNKTMVTENDGSYTTWLQVQRPDDTAEISCHVNGDYGKEYTAGKTIRMLGKVDKDPAEVDD